MFSLNRLHSIICVQILLLYVGSAGAQFVETDARVIHEFEVNVSSLGWAVSELKDINSDGVTDLIAGDTRNSKVMVYSGASGELIYEFSQPVNLGFAVADAGDVNGDGTHDIVAGATQSTNSGQVFVYSGADGSLLYTFDGESNGDRFGSAVSSAGDINGDGRADILIGARQNSTQQFQSGRAYIYSGADGTLIRTLEAEGASDSFGRGAGLMGDVNGDGVSDQVVGAPTAANGVGRAYVFSGATGAVLYSINPDSGSFNFGTFFVAGVGDVNADGTPDGYVGDFSHNTGAGRAYVFSGKDGSIIYRFSGSVGEGAGPGRGAGDVDGDGHADIIVGFYTAGGNNGRAVVYSGKDGSMLQQFTHTISGAQFGFDAVGVGDLDGDGRFDFLVSAPPDDKVYVMAGNTNRAVANNFVINGGLSGAWADTSVSGQGLLVDVFDEPDRKELFVAWFTYNTDPPPGNETDGFGSIQHRWFTAQGPFDGNRAELTLFLTSGGEFDSPLVTTTEAIGSLILEFDGCTQGQATYQFSSAGINGSFPINKLLPATVCEALSGP